MSAFVVWMDHQHAKLFVIKPGKIEAKALEHRAHDHHTHDHKEDKRASDAFFHELIRELKSASEVLLMGPGTAKTEFQHHLTKHHHNDLAQKIVGVETVDHPTENKILEFSRKFFKKNDLFTSSI